jgi:transposase-like protein
LILLSGWAMPKSYSGDLRERVIEAVEMGASRHEAAERFEVSVSSTVKWLQRWRESRSAAPKPLAKRWYASAGAVPLSVVSMLANLRPGGSKRPRDPSITPMSSPRIPLATLRDEAPHGAPRRNRRAILRCFPDILLVVIVLEEAEWSHER